MSCQKQLKVFTLKYDERTNSISPGVSYINPEETLREMYKIIGCYCVTCTAIEINGKKYDVWSDDEALLVDNPVPNLYIDDDTVIFGNLLIAKSNAEGAMIGLDNGELQLLYAFAQMQYPKLLKWLKKLGGENNGTVLSRDTRRRIRVELHGI